MNTVVSKLGCASEYKCWQQLGMRPSSAFGTFSPTLRRGEGQTNLVSGNTRLSSFALLPHRRVGEKVPKADEGVLLIAPRRNLDSSGSAFCVLRSAFIGRDVPIRVRP